MKALFTSLTFYYLTKPKQMADNQNCMNQDSPSHKSSQHKKCIRLELENILYEWWYDVNEKKYQYSFYQIFQYV